MKVPVWICSILLTAAIAAQAWVALEIVTLKVSVAEHRCRCGSLAKGTQ